MVPGTSEAEHGKEAAGHSETEGIGKPAVKLGLQCQLGLLSKPSRG